jgi:hypothetical protein
LSTNLSVKTAQYANTDLRIFYVFKSASDATIYDFFASGTRTFDLKTDTYFTTLPYPGSSSLLLYGSL